MTSSKDGISYRERKELSNFIEGEKQRLTCQKKVPRSVGRWCPGRQQVLVTRPKGKQWQVFGFMEKGSLYLQPEEALYLMEMGDLEVETDPVGDVTKQEMYGIVMDSRLSLEAYQVFVDLNRAGFAVWSRFIDVHGSKPTLDLAPPDQRPSVKLMADDSLQSTEEPTLGTSRPVKQTVHTKITKDTALHTSLPVEQTVPTQSTEETALHKPPSAKQTVPSHNTKLLDYTSSSKQEAHTRGVKTTSIGSTQSEFQPPADQETLARRTLEVPFGAQRTLRRSDDESPIIRSNNECAIRTGGTVLERGKLFFEVHSRSKKFKKTDPGPPLCYIAVINADEDFPTGEMLQNYSASLPAKAPLNLAVVDEGTVTLLSTTLGLIPKLNPSETH